jgi:hypothetical protein
LTPVKDGTAIFFHNDELESLCWIIGKKYKAVKYLRHREYGGNWGSTVVFTTEALAGYSEAFAGSGEFAAAILVTRLLRAKAGSLVLLDEPETSLHPEAQRRMLMFVLERARRRTGAECEHARYRRSSRHLFDDEPLEVSKLPSPRSRAPRRRGTPAGTHTSR